MSVKKNIKWLLDKSFLNNKGVFQSIVVSFALVCISLISVQVIVTANLSSFVSLAEKNLISEIASRKLSLMLEAQKQKVKDYNESKDNSKETEHECLENVMYIHTDFQINVKYVCQMTKEELVVIDKVPEELVETQQNQLDQLFHQREKSEIDDREQAKFILLKIEVSIKNGRKHVYALQNLKSQKYEKISVYFSS
ncbi:MAG: hypothetical protein ACRCUP_01930 [Mycoplasmatales bacterium]